MPLPADEYASALNRLRSAVMNNLQSERGAACYELELLGRSLKAVLQ